VSIQRKTHLHLLLSEIFPPTHGGSGRWFWEIAKRSSADSLVIVTNHHPCAAQFDSSHQLDIERISLHSPEWGLVSLKGLSFYIKTLAKVRRILKQSHATSIHCGRCIPEGFIGYLSYRLFGTPYICFVHGEDIETARQSRELSWLASQALKNAAALICNSNNTAEILKKRWEVDGTKLHIIHPGVDTDYFKPKARSLDDRMALDWADRPVILTVGRLQRRKGHDKMIESLPVLLEKHPNLLYAIIGDGEELQNLQSLAKSLGVSHAVQFKTDASDQELLKAYQQCDLFILPNRTVGNDIEGFGMVLVEAQSCGKPAIGGDSGGTKEAVQHSKTGWIIDWQTPSTAAPFVSAKLTEILNNPWPPERTRSWIVENLDWKVVTEKQVNITEKVVS
jgi:phosphatidylinositol alpha-1,6-mannosyltransferase